MLELGRYNELKVVKVQEIGAFLNGGEYGEILLPIRYVPRGLKAGQWLEVFIYRDSEDLVIATTLEPLAEVGDVAWLKCTQVTDFGAFVDWGLPKDLLVPFREQARQMEAGKGYWVAVYLDKASQRIAGSTKLTKFIHNTDLDVQEGDEVELGIVDETDLGYKALVNGRFWGILYRNEVYRKLLPGDMMRGYIKKVRSDNKLDVSLRKQGYESVPEEALRLVNVLKERKGHLPLNDDSSPEEIHRLLNMSKKTFKKAVGALYKQRMITLSPDGIRLVDGSKK